MLLTPSLNPGIGFARSDFSDIAPSVTSFGPIFLLLPRFDYPAGTGSIAPNENCDHGCEWRRL
jgi:hypothetical protein